MIHSLTPSMPFAMLSNGTTAGSLLLEERSSQDPHEIVNINQIVLLCISMYGTLGCAWLSLQLPFVRNRMDDRKGFADFKLGLLLLTWASTSVGMHVLNKSLVSMLEAPALITMAQMLMSTAAMTCVSFWKVFQLERRQFLMWMVVPFFFAGMLCSSFYTYEYISLSMLTVVRNLAPLISLPIEAVVMPEDKKPKVTFPIVGSLMTMLLGAIVYTRGVTDVSVLGLVFALANMVIALADRILQRRLLTTECKDMSSDVCTLITNFFGIFPTLALALITGQTIGQHKEMWTNPSVLLLLGLSGAVGLGIAYLGFECQRAISATAFFVLQNVSKLLVVALGVVFFGDPLTRITIAGISLSMLGSFFYGSLQMRKPDKATETTPLTPLK